MITAFVGGNPLAEGRFGVRLLIYAGFLIFMCVVIVAQLILHEAGHLIARLLSGYKFSSFRVFSFMWLRDGNRIRLCRLSIAGTGGQCLMTPPPMKDGKIPVMLYNLGGPLMNLILAIASAIISVAVGIMTLPGVLLMIFAAAGLTFAITNGVPMHTGTVELEQADELMEHMLGIESGIIGVHRNLLICDRMYIELITDCLREVIDSMRTPELVQFMKLMKKFPSVLRTQYVYYLLCERDFSASEETKKQFELCAKKYPYPCGILSERELMTIA